MGQRLNLNRRQVWSLALLGVLAVLAVVTVVVLGDDDETTDDAATSTTAGPVAPDDDTVPDQELAAALLPAVSALGPDWIETQRDDTATAAEPTNVAGCPAGPVPEGFLVRGEQHHTRNQQIVESLAITAGILRPGVEPISLEDDAIAACLLDGLRSQLGEGATAEEAADVTLGAPPAGAQVSHVRYVVTGSDIGGRFDFVLVRRDRMVSLGLLTGTDPAVATELSAVVRALDAPLQAAVDRLE